MHLSLGYRLPDADAAVLYQRYARTCYRSHSIWVHDGLLRLHSGFTMSISKALCSFKVHSRGLQIPFNFVAKGNKYSFGYYITLFLSRNLCKNVSPRSIDKGCRKRIDKGCRKVYVADIIIRLPPQARSRPYPLLNTSGPKLTVELPRLPVFTPQ